MDPILTHLRVNHFPVVLAMLGAVAVLVGIISRRRAPWRYATMTLVLAGLSAYPAVFTGQQAEGKTRKEWYFVRGSIHEHEEAAEKAMWLMIATGLLAAWALWQERGYQRADRLGHPARIAAPIWLQALITLGALGSAAMVTEAGLEGGKITHENRNLVNPPPGWVAPPAQQQGTGEGEGR